MIIDDFTFRIILYIMMAGIIGTIVFAFLSYKFYTWYDKALKELEK